MSNPNHDKLGQFSSGSGHAAHEPAAVSGAVQSHNAGISKAAEDHARRAENHRAFVDSVTGGASALAAKRAAAAGPPKQHFAVLTASNKVITVKAHSEKQAMSAAQAHAAKTGTKVVSTVQIVGSKGYNHWIGK